MKPRRRFTDEQKIEIVKKWKALREEGWKIKQIVQQVGVDSTSLYRWGKEFLPTHEPSREIVAKSNGQDEVLKQLRIENERLKFIVAEKCLDIQALQEYAGRK